MSSLTEEMVHRRFEFGNHTGVRLIKHEDCDCRLCNQEREKTDPMANLREGWGG